MFTSHRYLLVAALVMGLAATQVQAFVPGQLAPRVNLNPLIGGGQTLQQAAYNTAVLGQAYQQVPPYLFGYNPYPQINYTDGPSLPLAPLAASPYALSTTPSYNPYMGTGALGTSPYGLSTTGSGLPPGSYGSFPGYGYQDPYGAALQGYAAYTTAAAQYHLTTQKARQERETARQMGFDTIRKRLELERWIESNRPTAQQMRDKEFATELKLARTDSPEGDISSGKALNVLLGSIQRGGQLNLAQSPPLEEDTLKHINLTGAGASGNIGMLKDVTNLAWPEALKDPNFDATRKNLNKSLIQAVTVLKDGDPVPDGTLKDIRADYKTLNEKVNDGADELTPSQYIESRRFLNQLNQGIRALGDKNVGKHFSKNSAWTAKGKNVAELVAQLNKEGLSFAPAAPGDQGAYKALYLAMRQFETSLASAQAPK